jgi:hypothetical protein
MAPVSHRGRATSTEDSGPIRAGKSQVALRAGKKRCLQPPAPGPAPWTQRPGSRRSWSRRVRGRPFATPRHRPGPPPCGGAAPVRWFSEQGAARGHRRAATATAAGPAAARSLTANASLASAAVAGRGGDSRQAGHPVRRRPGPPAPASPPTPSAIAWCRTITRPTQPPASPVTSAAACVRSSPSRLRAARAPAFSMGEEPAFHPIGRMRL